MVRSLWLQKLQVIQKEDVRRGYPALPGNAAPLTASKLNAAATVLALELYSTPKLCIFNSRMPGILSKTLGTLFTF